MEIWTPWVDFLLSLIQRNQPKEEEPDATPKQRKRQHRKKKKQTGKASLQGVQVEGPATCAEEGNQGEGVETTSPDYEPPVQPLTTASPPSGAQASTSILPSPQATEMEQLSAIMSDERKPMSERLSALFRYVPLMHQDLRKDVNDLKKGINDLKKNINDLEKNINDLREDLRKDINDMKKEINDAREDLKKEINDVREEMKYEQSLSEHLLQKMGLLYGIAIRGILPSQVDRLEGEEIDRTEFVNRKFSGSDRNTPALTNMKDRLQETGYCTLLSYLQGYTDGHHDPYKLSTDTPSIEIDIFAYVNSATKRNSAKPPSAVRESPSRTDLSVRGHTEGCEYLLIGETTLMPICTWNLFTLVREEFEGGQDQFDNWLRNQPKSDNRRIRCLIFKLLQLEQQLTFLHYRYGQDCVTRVFLIDPGFVGIQHTEYLPRNIMKLWGRFLPELQAQWSKGHLTFYTGCGAL